ncbi:MAG TPA: PASTA domain-containing protein [Gaiellaceae bacterium]|nr:PASTA domain-containing protein [Gaiellaceae bacterium]
MPRLAIVGVVLLLASATLAVGAAKKMAATPQGAPAPVAIPTVTVPDIKGQAFVFAKGTLEDAGLAWKVVGSVHGFAANKVATQSPAAGTKLKDTGAPTITVKLQRTSYPEQGEPEDVSPYFGTSVQPIGLKPTTPVPAATPKPAAPPATKQPAAPKQAASRKPDFVVRAAPKEPSDEMPLTQRAKLLAGFIDSHPKSAANVRRFLYQHSWIVTGAKFGWWHGADALRELIAADEAAQHRWGIGRKSELVARAALAEVEARSK